ncbi:MULTISPECIES: MerR family transcriptional regulator [Actinomadura]|uniref:MerR family transcriptional regulator n=1 Tax=Actinomadura yumaensis TaxID=111807 RepID=A0ABW2CYG3_9ACTN|nr:MerR family transcriptional regulator [Actinomadura sp. J1-007]MWK39541.1 MerR family transcriptional regulator [Actinomadura sp. J1-007]
MDGTEKAEDLVPIGDVAARFGMAVSALRYWDECGLVAPAERRGGRRWYGPDELHRIALVRIWQGTGLMSLEEIAAVLAGGGEGRDWRATVQGRVRAVEAQIDRLNEAKAYLEHLLTCPSDHPADRCPRLRAATRRWTGEHASPGRVRRGAEQGGANAS